MAFTRFHDDPERIKAQSADSSFLGRYLLNVPGPGNYIEFMEEPQIRLQKWGANIRTNTMNIDNDLKGLTRKINYRHTDAYSHEPFAVNSFNVEFPIKTPFVEETRTTHPSWMYRSLENIRMPQEEYNNRILPIYPQTAPGNFYQGSFGLQKGFHENISTRILEKDYFVPKVPVVSFNHNEILPSRSSEINYTI